MATTNLATAATTGSGMRILVVGEDSDSSTVSRQSDVFKRVTSELQRVMADHGHRMVDEEMVAVNCGWKIKTRRPKTELFEAAKLANSCDKPNTHSRFMAMFRMFADKKSAGYATMLRLRLVGEVYDLTTNELVTSITYPRDRAALEFSAPADCDKNCVTNHIGLHSADMATSVGETLGRILDGRLVGASYTEADNEHSANQQAQTKDNCCPDCCDTATTYQVTLRSFSTVRAMALIGMMSEEFPGYISHEIISKQPGIWKMEYVTQARVAKLDEWLNTMLMDMELDPDRDVIISILDGSLVLEKLSRDGQPLPRRVGPSFR